MCKFSVLTTKVERRSSRISSEIPKLQGGIRPQNKIGSVMSRKYRPEKQPKNVKSPLRLLEPGGLLRRYIGGLGMIHSPEAAIASAVFNCGFFRGNFVANAWIERHVMESVPIRVREITHPRDCFHGVVRVHDVDRLIFIWQLWWIYVHKMFTFPTERTCRVRLFAFHVKLKSSQKCTLSPFLGFIQSITLRDGFWHITERDNESAFFGRFKLGGVTVLHSTLLM